ncbi:L-serine ammonia-lyase [Acidisoma silvae]|uniref:L-serine dehydratase n=1 Tax=Acidisoma silvae TaxID=2802396 RepID=A0A963YSM0_9PROT|nr:L-serine ammonia-lyase [Acidisoma silvae]MCB8875772.1 L-serine ammonia-lyase [Acidisoma silvae]
MISVFDLFKIGIGPSSSHTVGPMKAAAAFVAALPCLPERIEVRLLGSLAWTGRGHATDTAVMLGLAGESPDTVTAAAARRIIDDARGAYRLPLGSQMIGFDPTRDIIFDTEAETPVHANTMVLTALDADDSVLLAERWCSVGGGFIAREHEVGEAFEDGAVPLPYPFTNGAEMLRMGEAAGLSVAGMMWENERARLPQAEIERRLDAIIAVMMDCIDRGMEGEGELPGGLKVRRRAKALLERMEAATRRNTPLPHGMMDRVSLYAIAVNEENAAGGRVVTAPTNGAAGVVPAVLRHYRDHCPESSLEGMRDFMLTAAAIGALFKINASISGAEMGCQGEVGVACSMAAAGLTAALGGSILQVENAAEIGMEHHLGMTCDPVAGLVQIPCIERNAFGAIKAINAASLSLHGDGTHRISLDQVIATMRQTGMDMQSKYKETSLGGLAVNFTEC